MNSALPRALLRSFGVQGSFNYERMVGVGLAYVMEPLLRDLARAAEPARYRRALARAASFFNAHPYLVAMGAGALARAERDAVPESQIERLKSALVASLGSVGDRLVWAGWLPVCSATGLIAMVTLSPAAGVVAFLVAYNGLHLGVRWWGLAAGWREGSRVAAALSGPVMQVALRVVGRAAPFTVGVALPVAADWLTRAVPVSARTGVAAIAVAAYALGRWLAPALGGVRIGLVLVGFALLAGVAWR
ncbi:MAG TPA: PTS system mannose/fructose/sorbose family transporter subunit IID [Gemmatimonadales bacterium]|nr:PTS system mannose/fructose/sorbose family transporter subunit IID [Gemmatimonadales bacterium]